MAKYSNKEWALRRYFWNQVSILYSVNLSTKYAMRRHVSINKPIFSGICAHFPMLNFFPDFRGLLKFNHDVERFLKNGVTTLPRVVNTISTEHGSNLVNYLSLDSKLLFFFPIFFYSRFAIWILSPYKLKFNQLDIRLTMLPIETPWFLVFWRVNYVKAIKIFHCTF